MPLLTDYHQFDGRLWDTGPVRNVLDYQGVVMPHTGQPPTEALLLGILGGVTAGYFVFEYEGHAPYLHFLTRNTFDPLENLLARLALPADVKQTTSADKGLDHLMAALEGGQPAIVWADVFSLPYSNLVSEADQWGMMPVVVYGVEGGEVWLSDRARVPLQIDVETFTRARARTSANKFRLMTLGEPDLNRLPEAVTAGISACLDLYSGAPPRGPKGNFGFDAYQKWADLLVNARDKRGWPKLFPAGPRLYAGLKSAYYYTHLWGTGGLGSRPLYADFLDEAADILGRPGLREAAAHFRASADQWSDLLHALLPDAVAPLRETRELLDREYELFMTRGSDSLTERRQMTARLDAIRDEMATDFPLTDAQAADLLAQVRERVLAIHDTEQHAVATLRAAMA